MRKTLHLRCLTSFWIGFPLTPHCIHISIWLNLTGRDWFSAYLSYIKIINRDLKKSWKSYWEVRTSCQCRLIEKYIKEKKEKWKNTKLRSAEKSTNDKGDKQTMFFWLFTEELKRLKNNVLLHSSKKGQRRYILILEVFYPYRNV